jgi:hypothetical protein
MIGETVYTRDHYLETVILEEESVQLIMCTDTHEFKLYRLCTHGTRLDGTAYYNSVDAAVAFQFAVSQAQ